MNEAIQDEDTSHRPRITDVEIGSEDKGPSDQVNVARYVFANWSTDRLGFSGARQLPGVTSSADSPVAELTELRPALSEEVSEIFERHLDRFNDVFKRLK